MVQLMECLHEWIQELDDEDNTISEFCLCCGIDHNQYRKIRTKIMGEMSIEIDRIGIMNMIKSSNQILNSESIGIHTPTSKQKEIEINQMDKTATIKRGFTTDVNTYGNKWNDNKREEYRKIKELQRRQGIK